MSSFVKHMELCQGFAKNMDICYVLPKIWTVQGFAKNMDVC
jgi:hypothetical protein